MQRSGLAVCTAANPPRLGHTSSPSRPYALQVVKTTESHVVQVDASGRASPLELKRLDGFIADLAGNRPEALRLTIKEARNRTSGCASFGEAHRRQRHRRRQDSDRGAADAVARWSSFARSDQWRSNARSPRCPTARPWSKLPAAPMDNTTSARLGCSNLNNLAVMVADPNDLVAGSTRLNADGATGAAAVKRYHDDKVKVLVDHNAAFAPGGGGSGGASGGGQ